ncbi:putative membrane protein [Wickerhamomyces ciferrii]|uniref:Membrane protein n=1 Tax=Wickerhamomyces ciferrii (strain ATCC 14091 / BCRC 22168 / CBS 111 / JCM 3599 / NBRC 0793 / NRRL Y-1031 F-60-10) TaxID=1206466 RepID=K0KUK1_WICCF|nr:uncharacterized protein BN7_4688 [Wickerhamomyces ciferrii]CCH45109.1 putative membrane protein [Wickerhamomyces ciferrii]
MSQQPQQQAEEIKPLEPTPSQIAGLGSNGTTTPFQDAESEYEDIARIVSRSHTDPDGGVLAKLETLSKKLSKRSNRQGPYDIDPEDFDFQRVLSTFLRSADEQGIHLRSTGVVFKDVTTLGVDSASSYAPTVQDMLLMPVTIYKGIKAAKSSKKRKIISNITGVVKPGEMCLVLGRPGAGCSTFLKTVAGEHDQFVDVSGDIHYDQIPQDEMMKKYKSDVIYNGELDTHFPHLTVDQTLRFAIACKTPHTRVNNATREQYITANRDLLATIFGLRHTYNTKVGNDFVRGVSGGERKRVSIAEALATKATVYCWDNATRGLDASTALEYAQAIRTSTSLSKNVAFITLYQAGENIYETFDKVTVLYDGRQVYFGTTENAKAFFENMGFEAPARQTTAEFLTAVTDPAGRFPKPGFESRVPKTVDDFERYWLNSPEYKALVDEIKEYESVTNADNTRDVYDKSFKQEKPRVHYRYTLTYPQQLKLVVKRGFDRIYGDKAYTIVTCVAATIQALVVGSLYYNTPDSTNGAFSRAGTLFFMILYYSLMALAEVAGQFAERPILLKQKSYSMFHPSTETFASALTKFPFKLLSLTVFYLLIYFLSNMNRQAGKFFLNYLFLILSAEAIAALFQAVAALSQNVAGANAVSGVLMLAISIYTCYMIQLKSMHPWFKWISYINPIRYGFENLLVDEFQGRKMSCANTLVPSGPGYESVSTENQVCAFVGSKPGVPYVSGDDYMRVQYGFSYNHIWRNFGILIAFLIAFLAVNAVCTEFKRPVKGGGDHLYFKRGKKVPSDEVLLSSDAAAAAVGEGPVAADDLEAGGPQVGSNRDQDLKDQSSSENEVFEGLGSTSVFSWQNVDYVIPYKGGERKLLDNVQGYVKPGTLTALMGESGAGKTTLLNTLAQRIDMGTVTGDMLVNGRPLDNSFQRSTGYVQQQDLHIAELTVRESLQFAARLRRPKSVPDEEKLDYVEKIIKILQMDAYAEALVGTLGSGLNVEQRKKLSIGTELVAKPSLLLFLDEPTSGLDSQSSWAIVNLLRKLAEAGQSILCTIHQPSATLFEAFDRLLLLKKGGQTVYFGDIGKNSRVLLDYFERNGARHCERHENPAEYILESIGAGATASVHEDWYEKWCNSAEYESTTREIQQLVADGASKPVEHNKELEGTYALPYWDQLMYVTRRTGTQFWRDPQYISAKFFLIIIGGLFIGFTFWAMNDSIIGMQNGMFVVFLSIIVSAPAMNQIQERAIASRELFEVRESKSNTYHWSTLLLAQYMNEIPYHLVINALYFCCLYFPLRINNATDRAGVWYLNYSVVFQFYYVSLALLIVYMAPDLASASVLTGLVFSFMVSFCGVVQPASLMPGFWTFMYKVSPLTYIIQTLMSLILHEKKVVCSKDEYNYFDPPSGMTCQEFAGPFVEHRTGYLQNPSATSNCGYCQYSVADEYMSTVGVKYSYRWRNFGFMWVYIIFNLAAMCTMYYLLRVSKVSPFGFIKNRLEAQKSKKEAKKNASTVQSESSLEKSA